RSGATRRRERRPRGGRRPVPPEREGLSPAPFPEPRRRATRQSRTEPWQRWDVQLGGCGRVCFWSQRRVHLQKLAFGEGKDLEQRHGAGADVLTHVTGTTLVERRDDAAQMRQLRRRARVGQRKEAGPPEVLG